MTAREIFVLIVPESSLSTTFRAAPSCVPAGSAERSADFRTFLGTDTWYSLGLGPKTVPPPTHTGDVELAALARPVPFWRHGFFPPPRTSPRVFVEACPAVC